ncbi:hypothetical protein TU94_16965 [Streptomyces cyaneogriseus subsp. noncyanogenus]|uniref:DUF4232 domain-containing protein n=1 Tax=Streptomyces cyaneogriseus subsp. noncyanogenus TaxID=477245 RepID=A0A0C5FS88_9ACTN|nr:DUF4232 domain-containing protein [Streptomyces cyaneogriseus]AJP02917.1 hypothetical protein TU94_16965 [Streptomyces cyaneogriseus subsp. noncyanogenus]
MRTSRPLVATGALAAVLLLGACGPQPSVSEGAGGEPGTARECRSGGDSAAPGRVPEPGETERDGVRITGRQVPEGEAEASPAPAPSGPGLPGPSRAARPGSDGAARPGNDAATAPGSEGLAPSSEPLGAVRAETLPGLDLPEGERAGEGAGSARCLAEYTVTNREAEAFTYTITFDFLSGQGEVMARAEETVASVGPGRTVRRTVGPEGRVAAAGAGPERFGAGQVRISGVRRVPAGEAPAPAGSCPPSGVRLTADEGDAAMGLRVVGLRLENCGSRPYSLDGYPALELLGEDRKPVAGVRVVRGSGGIAQVTGFDDPPRPVTLEPGETASAGLMWRNTTEFGTPVHVPYVRVTAGPGADPVTVTPELDLGTTGTLGVRAWREDR